MARRKAKGWQKVRALWLKSKDGMERESFGGRKKGAKASDLKAAAPFYLVRKRCKQEKGGKFCCSAYCFG